MEALRQILDVDSQSLSIHLPEGFSANKVEVIILPIDEPKPRRKKSYTTVKVDAKGYKFNRDELYER